MTIEVVSQWFILHKFTNINVLKNLFNVNSVNIVMKGKIPGLATFSLRFPKYNYAIILIILFLYIG